jgi:hypothetical protein
MLGLAVSGLVGLLGVVKVVVAFLLGGALVSV